MRADAFVFLKTTQSSVDICRSGNILWSFKNQFTSYNTKTMVKMCYSTSFQSCNWTDIKLNCFSWIITAYLTHRAKWQTLGEKSWTCKTTQPRIEWQALPSTAAFYMLLNSWKKWSVTIKERNKTLLYVLKWFENTKVFIRYEFRSHKQRYHPINSELVDKVRSSTAQMEGNSRISTNSSNKRKHIKRKCSRFLAIKRVQVAKTRPSCRLGSF